MEPTARYRTVRHLGQGGMAEVLEAVSLGEEGFSRRVAIKRIRAEHANDAAFVRMFLDEARIASRLHHGNIVAVLDYGIADGVPFQILEFVDGVDANTLRNLAKSVQQTLPVEIALHICTEVAHALHHAHGARDGQGNALGIVHRDATPHNVMVSWDGDVKLNDFGIAVARDRTERTQTGMAKGKLSYMAPEQATAGEVDGRADVFTLGCALHALLAGKSPLADENRMAALLTGAELPLDPSLPEDVRAIVARAVRRSRTERFQTAAEMADALGRALHARIGRDARTVLREWLTGLRPREKAPAARGRLDQMLDVELVLDRGAREPGVRTFTTKAVPAVESAVEAAAAAASTVQVPMRGSEGRVRRRVSGSAAAGLVAVGIVAAMGVARFAPLLLGTDATPIPTGTSTSPAAAVSPAVASTAAPLATATTVALVSASPIPPHPAASRTPRPATTAAPAVVVSAAKGTLKVGGAGAVRARVLVDGAPIGYAPGDFAVPVGAHRVTLVADGGRVVAEKKLELTEMHTRFSPYVWLVDAP